MRDRGPVIAAALLAAAACLLVAPGRPASTEAPDDILVVANNGVGVSSISVGDLKDVFLKKRQTVGGDKVVPVNAPAASDARKAFRKKVLGLSEKEEELFWVTEQVKSGVTRPPEFSNTLKAVFKIKGGISYVKRADYVKGTGKVLLVIPAR